MRPLELPVRRSRTASHRPFLVLCVLLGALGALSTAAARTTAPRFTEASRAGRTVATASSRGSHGAAPLAAYRIVQIIPIFLTINPSSPSAGSTVTVSVTVNEAPTVDSAVQVMCSPASGITSPSGSWPYTLSFPAGSTTQSFTVTASSSATLGACQTGVDATNSANWTASASVTVTSAN